MPDITAPDVLYMNTPMLIGLGILIHLGAWGGAVGGAVVVATIGAKASR